jgi:hypothetical protein
VEEKTAVAQWLSWIYSWKWHQKHIEAAGQKLTINVCKQRSQANRSLCVYPFSDWPCLGNNIWNRDENLHWLHYLAFALPKKATVLPSEVAEQRMT